MGCLLTVMLDLRDDTVPLRALLFFGTYHSSVEDISREPVFIEYILFSHHGLPLYDHVNFDLVSLRIPLHHAVLVGLTHHSDDEVHENDVAND